MKAVLVDDEPLLSEHLRGQLACLWPELEVIAMATTAREALALFEEEMPDVVFLDIHMPGMSGLQLAAELPASVRIVFVTAYEQYAVEAFQEAAVDYLLKPVTETRLKKTVSRLQAQPPQDHSALAELLVRLNSQPSKAHLQWLKCTQGDVTSLVAVADVVYFKSSHKYTEVHTKDQTHLIRQSIKELEESLNPDEFWRVHRGVLLRVDQIVSAVKDFSGRYKINLADRPDQLICSKSYAHLFRQS